MKNGKVLFLLLCLILMVGMIGCSGGSNSGGSTTSTPPSSQTPTQKLVGTWNFVSSDDGLVLGKLVFNADGNGDWGGSGFTSGRIDNGVLFFTLGGGQPEAFDIKFNTDNNITLTNHNGGLSYSYSRA
jgi:hypothetical protein